MEHYNQESDSDRPDHVIKIYKNGESRSLFALKNIVHSCADMSQLKRRMLKKLGHENFDDRATQAQM